MTPEYVALKEVLHAMDMRMWQAAGGKKAGPKPKPPKLPEDKEVKVKTTGDLKSRRQQQAEHLRRRRAQREQERR